MFDSNFQLSVFISTTSKCSVLGFCMGDPEEHLYFNTQSPSPDTEGRWEGSIRPAIYLFVSNTNLLQLLDVDVPNS